MYIHAYMTNQLIRHTLFWEKALVITAIDAIDKTNK